VLAGDLVVVEGVGTGAIVVIGDEQPPIDAMRTMIAAPRKVMFC
jgi:hypothetical protein